MEHRVGYHKLPYPTSVSGIIVLLNTRHWTKISRITFPATRVFGHFEGTFSEIKLSVSVFGQTTGYRIYTVSREPFRLLETKLIHCLIFNEKRYMKNALYFYQLVYITNSAEVLRLVGYVPKYFEDISLKL